MKILLIDNRDSFTFNLADSFRRLGAQVEVHRNSIPAEVAAQKARAVSMVVLSPGPGRPPQAGCCLSLIERLLGQVPVLGICLGHQAILEAAGAPVVRADAIVHGKASALMHDGAGPFQGLPQRVQVARYHSLCVQEAPQRFRVHAQLGQTLMAVSDTQAMQVGLQFHPESILTPQGDQILKNTMSLLIGSTS